MSKKSKQPIIINETPIHEWFNLSYAEYLTIPRSVLQSMPVMWQKTFVKCLEELDAMIDWRPENNDRYYCFLKDGTTGRFKEDVLGDYERGRRRLHYRTMICNRHTECNSKCKAKVAHEYKIDCCDNTLCGNELSQFYCKPAYCIKWKGDNNEKV